MSDYSTTKLAEICKVSLENLFYLLEKRGYLTKENKNRKLTINGVKLGGKYVLNKIAWNENILKNADFIEMINLIKTNDEKYKDKLSTTKMAQELNLTRDELNEILFKNNFIFKEGNKFILTKKGENLGGSIRTGLNENKWIVWDKKILNDKNFTSLIKFNDSIKLPAYEDLNKDQEYAINLPKDGVYLIVGGPGTGKSVVGLLRALKFHNDNDKFYFLAFNKVLIKLSKKLLKILNNSNTNTLNSWMYDKYKNLTNQEYEDNYLDKFYDFLNSEDYEVELKDDYLIIDEAQDKSSKFYMIMRLLGYQNFTILADQNQQITDENSSKKDLMDTFEIFTDEVVELKINYRNSTPIAKFAETFFTDPSSPKPQIPNRPSLDNPILYFCSKNIDQYIRILKEYDSNPRQTICVVMPNTNKLKEFESQISEINISMDNDKPKISSYYSDKENNKSVDIEFKNGEIIILNDKSIKGTEFDTVFVILDDFYLYSDESVKKRLYVISSRARKKLFFFTNNKNNKILNYFPQDENLIKKEELKY